MDILSSIFQIYSHSLPKLAFVKDFRRSLDHKYDYGINASCFFENPNIYNLCIKREALNQKSMPLLDRDKKWLNLLHQNYEAHANPYRHADPYHALAGAGWSINSLQLQSVLGSKRATDCSVVKVRLRVYFSLGVKHHALLHSCSPYSHQLLASVSAHNSLHPIKHNCLELIRLLALACN